MQHHAVVDGDLEEEQNPVEMGAWAEEELEEDGFRFDMAELHPPLLVDFDLLRRSRPRQSSPEHGETQIASLASTAETEEPLPSNLLPRPPSPPTTTTTPLPPSSTTPRSSTPRGTFGTVYQSQDHPPSPSSPQPTQPPPLLATPSPHDLQLITDIIIAAPTSNADSDDEMVVPDSIRKTFLFRRAGCGERSNQTSPGSTGRVFRHPRLRKMKGRCKLEDLEEEAALDETSRYRRERKQRIRRTRKVAPTPPIPDDAEEVDETLDLNGPMDWNEEPQFMEQQQAS